uniref:F-box domain-containing protein n=1 Tax=Oryza punctata TaxID=4537 RepID=A0A0E0K190_ORYPU
MGGAIELDGALLRAPWGEPEAAELIPGLPDDVAMECLARVPSRSHRAMRHVCRGWRRAAASEAFRRRRRMAGAAEDVVFLVQATLARGGDGKGSAAATECALAAANLTTGDEGVVYVAGGHDESKNALRSAYAYDVAADAWRALPDMSEERDEPQLVATQGRMLAASGYPTDAQGAFKKTAERYTTTTTTTGDATAWSSEGDMAPNTAETCLSAVGGKVWAVGAGKGGVREWDGGAWRDVADGPPGMKACVKAVGVGDGDGAAVFVFGKVEDGKHAAWVTHAGGAARWRPVPVPPGFGGVGFGYSS